MKWLVFATTYDWSSNEANNAANQANQAINPGQCGGQWLIPYQRSKSILMPKLFQGLLSMSTLTILFFVS